MEVHEPSEIRQWIKEFKKVRRRQRGWTLAALQHVGSLAAAKPTSTERTHRHREAKRQTLPATPTPTPERGDPERERITSLGRPRKGAYIGVSRRPSGRYGVQICVGNGKTLILGTFDTDVEAAQAYDAEARELGRPESSLNFPIPAGATR